jgi:hypothetical protein
MSRSTQNFVARSLRIAGIITAAAVAAPAIALAKTGDGERALLNHIDNPAAAVTAIAPRPGARYTFTQQSVDGERALAVHIPVTAFTPGGFAQGGAQAYTRWPITGSRALLGKE